MLHAGTSLRRVMSSQFLIPRMQVSKYRGGPHSFQQPMSTSQTRSPTKTLPMRRIISTLRRESLKKDDHIDFSDRQLVCLRIPQEVPTFGQSALNLSPRGRVLLKHFNDKELGFIPFPSGTRGFLYYFLPPFAPPIAGQIRFRITPSQDPSSFSSGHDLRHPVTTLPMSWSLRSLVSSEQRLRLAALLLHDGLITKKLLHDTIKTVNFEAGAFAANLYAFGQPFYLNLQTGVFSFDILAVVDGKNVAERAEVTLPASSISSGKYPYTGSAICCFVKPTPGRIFIKVLKILKKIELAYPEAGKDFVLPQEGQLLPTRYRTWSCRIPAQEAISPDYKWALRLLKECPGVTWDMF